VWSVATFGSMNAPTEPFLSQIDCRDTSAQPVDFGSQNPEYVRLTSRPLGWHPLNFERREAPPASDCMPGGSSEHLIFVALDGGGRVRRESEGEQSDYELAPGYIAVQPSGKPVRWSWDARVNFSVMSLDPAFLDRVAEEVYALAPREFELATTERAQDPVLSNIAGVLSREVVRGEAGDKLYAESLANILAVHLLRNYTARQETQHDARERAEVRHPPHSRGVGDAIRYMQENYARDLQLSDIAAAAHLSAFHLSRLFKQVTGVAPHQYLIQLRVNAARGLLDAGSGQRSLAEVASAVGFADQSHLTRHFKRQFGVTPKHFR
jgi:AraC family transcriptional regulator